VGKPTFITIVTVPKFRDGIAEFGFMFGWVGSGEVEIVITLFGAVTFGFSG
jgi:hypothetical protein